VLPSGCLHRSFASRLRGACCVCYETSVAAASVAKNVSCVGIPVTAAPVTPGDHRASDRLSVAESKHGAEPITPAHCRDHALLGSWDQP
jgi:hypothetical protein